MVANLDAYKSGQVAMQMNWFAFFPESPRTPRSAARSPGSSSTRARRSRLRPWAARGVSVVSYSDKKDQALQYIKWFAKPDVQKKWWSLGGYSCHNAVLGDPGFADTARSPPTSSRRCRA